MDDFRVAPDDMIETIGLFDPRAKIISEELANPLGKKIIQVLSSSELTTGEISKKLNASIQCVAYHVRRLLEAGIIRIVRYELGPRGKDMKRYALRKPSILLIVDPPPEDEAEFLKTLKKIALKRFFERALFSVFTFITSSLTTYWLLQSIIKGNAKLQEILDPDALINPLLPTEPTVTASPVVFEYLVASFMIGLIASFIAWYMLSRKLFSINVVLKKP